MGPVCADGSTVHSPMSGMELSYRVKNTFVEIGPCPKDEAYLRGRRCKSDATDKLKVASPQLGPARSPRHSPRVKEASFVPDTPSPMMRPAPDQEVPPMEGYPGMGEEDMCLPPAWSEEAMMLGMAYDSDMSAYYQMPMMYDPMSGSWCPASMCMPLQGMGVEDMGCEMVGMDGQVMMENDGTAPEEGMWDGDMAMCCMEADPSMLEGMTWAMPETPPEAQQEWNAEATPEKKEAAPRAKKVWEETEKDWGKEATQETSSRWQDSRGRQGNRKTWRDEGSNWDDRKDEGWDSWDYNWRNKGRSARRARQDGWQENNWGERDWRWSQYKEEPEPAEEAPEEAEVEVEAEGGSIPASSSSESLAAQTGESGYTTVMLRNIPNKYTREMLVKQLNQDFKGRFDFVYLPIDFKNKCNVGYGFINFRTSPACDEFIAKYDGVDVRKCLPGLNSKKIAGVTPARVQGLEENVRRLRTGPVMNELVNHPEWMPLLLDAKGEAMDFPMPEHPAPAPKLKRRAREEPGARAW